MDKYYVGIDEDGQCETFASDSAEMATPEYSGYDEVWGPFDTLEEAKENCTD